MAEAGPSSPSRTFSSGTSSPNASARSSKQLRVQFPAEEDGSSAGDSISYRVHPIGLGPPPAPRKAIASSSGDIPPSTSARLLDDSRRRVRSADAFPALASQSMILENGDTTRYARTSRPNRRSIRKDRGLPNSTLDGRGDLAQSSAFSDEYDLSREGMIVEDVQRAIRLKQRREARLRSQSTHIPNDAQSKGDAVNAPRLSSPIRISDQNPSSTAPSSGTGSIDSEVDFSPSVGTVPPHPVPLSANDGATLDWAGSASEDDRDKRWPLHLHRRKRDRFTAASSRAVVEKQETLYSDKLARIKSKVTPLTLRKATMTKDQLERRYQMLLPGRNSRTASLNLLEVARWYDRQEPGAKAALDKAEPLTWLKHLLDRRPQRFPRIPWHLTALIMEEYAKTRISHHPMATIPEDGIPSKTPSPTALSQQEPKSPSSGSWSWNPSPRFLDTSTRRSSYDQQVSFEPHIESSRDSIGAESRPSSEGFTRHWRHSLPAGATESAPSSIYSGQQNGESPHRRHHLRNLAKRFRGRGYDSEDAVSSRRNSLSEQSVSGDAGDKLVKPRPPSRTSSSRLRSPEFSEPEKERTMPTEESKPDDEAGIVTITVSPPRNDPDDGTPRADSANVPAEPPVSPMRRAIPRRRIRTSLPSSQRIFQDEREKRQREVDEAVEHQQYEQKAQILEDARTQNHRTQQLLQRVTASVREYDSVQSGMSAALGMPFARLPPDVLEAFSRDPSAFTSGTRHNRGWRAVEDVHDRVYRQRKILQSVFEQPVDSLTKSLAELEKHKGRVTSQLEKVTELLIGVRHTHKAVKKGYNDTLAHTSLVYPELSYAVALEESYRNHYQQLWDIGLDALTLLLDTVTPFWRNYGKVIGQDVQDFLIIPWYRNEFTGEARRYPIEGFPIRSLRHWIGLLCLSLLSLCVTFLQVRAAYELTLNWGLPWITHAGLWWLIFPVYTIGLLIQWCAVLLEVCIVAAQSGVVVWWMGWAVKILT
ncbi:uncharacterized protein B0H18DRAFT_1113170 [Fomitopsis serialis]|uniref:uncharacterized protein n=1 Tax=Fomitopsis serialis TaxID=139415 RepID=UPI0020076009|nr:uncharacterized protein B0H18DRAFT_1113170 [Neoantrodia serialis]KAH9937313.1 hypothetical protein B0H18DRAFT_1113170 [Neoantrodia serialis]